jgi:hypothetical protein
VRAAGILIALAACGGGKPASSTPDQRGGSACAAEQALGVPGKRDNATGVRAGVVCDDGDCELTVSAGGPTRGFAIEEGGGFSGSDVGVRRADLDGDGADELVVLSTLVQAYGPEESGMEIITRTLHVLDAEELTLRWSSQAWGSTPPEDQSIACASEVTMSDPDCDGRREQLQHVRRCDPPMCAGVRAGEPADNDYVRDECGAREPLEERMTFVAAEPRGPFTALVN